MMTRPTAIARSGRGTRPLALAALLALSACAMDDLDDSFTDSRAGLGIKAAPMHEADYAEARTECGLPGSALTRFDTGWRLLLPPRTYAARSSRPVARKIACVETWARRRNLIFTVAESR